MFLLCDSVTPWPVEVKSGLVLVAPRAKKTPGTFTRPGFFSICA